jgi:hypothetical protein
MSPKPRMGRPPLPKGKARDIVFTVRMSPAERDEIVQAAKRDGVPATQWARGALLRAALAASGQGEA